MTIFCIDDDKANHFIAGHYIRQLLKDVPVFYFDNGHRALERLKSGAGFPDYIFLDLNMPIMDGWGFLEELNQMGSVPAATQVFILSSSICPHDIERSRSYATVKDFIMKPLTLNKLKIALGY